MRSSSAFATSLLVVLLLNAWAIALQAQTEQRPEAVGESITAESIGDPLGFDDAPADREPVKQREFTAQQRPRVSVIPFEDTNTEAANQGFGKAVSAMLVTYLKRRSQLIVVERDRLEKLLKEQDLTAKGATTETKEYASDAQTLERLDAFVYGNVTYLPTFSTPVEQASQGERRQPARADSIEIDAKLLSRQDGRIIGASQVGGSVSCLRQIVQRLGNALEHEFLRPFYGKLQVQLPKPQYARISLTPVLSEEALDEEKPPVELDRTITPGEWQQPDAEHIWVTNPSVVTISNVLAGLYTLRVRREGYDELSVDSEYEVRTSLPGDERVYNKDIEIDPDDVPLLVRVDRFEERTVDLSKKEMTKKGGSLVFEVQPQDSRFGPIEGLKVRLESEDLEINPRSPDPRGSDLQDEEEAEKGVVQGPEAEPAAGAGGCNYITPDSVPRPFLPLPEVLASTDQPFTFENFWGGGLTHEDYQGEKLPVGRYTAKIWAPNYEENEFTVQINNGSAIERRQLQREVGNVWVYSHKKHPDNKLAFSSETTGQVEWMPLNFVSWREKKLKVDRWRVFTDVPGFEKWETQVELTIKGKGPPWEVSDQVESRDRYIEVKVKADILVLGRTSTMVDDKQVLRFNSDLVSDFGPEAGLTEKRQEELSFLYDPVADQAAEKAERMSEERYRRRLAYLRQSLLKNVDLIVLDDDDIDKLKGLPDLAEVIRSFVAEGRAVMAYVSRPGDYSRVLGPGLVVDPKPRSVKSLEFYPGDVRQFLDRKIEISLDEKRNVHHLSNAKKGAGGWTRLALRKKGRDPLIVERGDFDGGGYVVVWVDSLDNVNEHSKSLKEKVEKRALQWTQYLMYKRLSSNPEYAREARARLGG